MLTPRALIREHTVQEPLPRLWIAESFFVFDRQSWQPLDKRFSEQTATACGVHFVPMPMNEHVVRSTAWRTRLQDESRHAQRREGVHTRASPMLHPRRPVLSSENANHAHAGRFRTDTVDGRDELNRLPRHTHPHFHLRTHGHPLDQSAQLHDERVFPLVTAVIADLVTKETTRDADARWIEIGGHTPLYEG